MFDSASAKLRHELRTNGEAEFEGVKLKYVGEWDTLEPGDTYIAGRNTGPHLLTVRDEVQEYVGVYRGWVNSVEPAYPFDLGECVKVRVVI